MNVIKDYYELTKPRIMLFLLLTAYCAMVVANKGIPPVGNSLLILVGLALSTGGSAVLNMWYDRDIDKLMARTKERPIATGRIRPLHALLFGLSLCLASILELGFTVNWLSAWLSLGGTIYYVVIYTIWLKRITPHNIVIGGGAGAFPPLIGWAGITGHLGWPAIVMFMIIFLWTPPHFWALALFKKSDYGLARIPMMPNVRGEKTTKSQMILYTVLLVLCSILLFFTHVVGVFYLIMATVLGLVFLGYCLRLLREAAPDVRWARKSFFYSLVYLALLFFSMVVNVT